MFYNNTKMNNHTKYCVAPGCSNVESPGITSNITFHNFPDKISKREEWFEFTGNAYTTVPVNAKVWKNWKICSEHFRPEDFIEEKFIIVDGAKVLLRTLRDNAKPTGTYKTNNDELPSAVVEAVLNLQSDISAMEDVETDPETSYTKCGEIFVSKSGNFLYLCKTCNITLSNIQLFTEHVCVTHIFSNTNDNEILQNEIMLSASSAIKIECGVPSLDASNSENLNTFKTPSKKSRKKIRFSLDTIKSDKKTKEKKDKMQNLQQTNNITKLQMDHKQGMNEIKFVNEQNSIIPNFIGIGGMNSCQFCGKTFKLNSSLMVHTRTHTGERPFDCSYCPSKFRSKSLLVLHIRTHTGEKPYSCAYCCKSFNGKSNLYVHERIHTGAKPYKCHFCDKRFNQKSAQVTHEKKHVLPLGEQKIHKCNKCNKVFSTAANLGSHKRIHQINEDN